MEIWEICVSAERYPGQLRAGTWKDLGLRLRVPRSRWPPPQELWASTSPAGRV